MHDSSLHVGSQPCIRLHLTLWKMFTLRVNGFPSHFSKREVQNPPSVGQGSWPRIFMGPPPLFVHILTNVIAFLVGGEQGGLGYPEEGQDQPRGRLTACHSPLPCRTGRWTNSGLRSGLCTRSKQNPHPGKIPQTG